MLHADNEYFAKLNTPAVKKDYDYWEGFSIRIKTPDGEATVIISEDANRSLNDIFFTIGKNGTSAYAWAFALAKQAVTNVKEKGLPYAIEQLENITTERTVYSHGALVAKSGPDALCMALKVYRDTFDHLRNDAIAKGYRPASFRRRDPR